MNAQTDQQLLRDYAENHSETAFAELVRRHIDLVYSAALRMVCDSHHAEDVTQGVFVALAQNARQLTHHPVLSGWLHRTTQNLAANVVRTNVRRQTREQEAVVMNELLSAEPDANWEHIAPHLDDALGELNELDRDALMLRYFERKSAQEMAQTLGISDEAAQKRVSRAVERLREFFFKRGVTVGVSGLAVVISANAVQAAPVGLALTISTATAITGTTIATTTTTTAVKIIAMTTLQKTLITAITAIAVGTGIYEARQASALRTEVQTLQQQQAPLAEQLTGLKTENERLASLVARTTDSQTLSQAQLNELLRLRSKSNLAQTDSRELAQLKSTLAQQSGKMPDYLTNAMAMGMATVEKSAKKSAESRVARMKQMLNLTDDQAQAISDILQKHIQSQSQMTMDLMTGKITPEQQQAMAGDPGNEEAEIKAVFTSAQLAAYPEFQQAEKITAADNSAKYDANRMADSFSLSKEQQEQIHAAFYQMNLNKPADGLSKEAIAAAKRSGNFEDAANLSIEVQKSQLEEKLKVLGSILTPEQINTYREEQMNMINMQAFAMKMFLPQKSAGKTN